MQVQVEVRIEVQVETLFETLFENSLVLLVLRLQDERGVGRLHTRLSLLEEAEVGGLDVGLHPSVAHLPKRKEGEAKQGEHKRTTKDVLEGQ